MPDSTATSEENIRLQQERLDLDKLNAHNDFALRQRELEIRERELNQKASEDQRSKWQNPLALAIVGALLAGFSSIAVTYLQNRSAAESARAKAQSDLILESTRTADPVTGKKNLLFFIKANLIDDPGNKITELINQDLYPSLPPALIAPDYAFALKNFRIAADQGDPRSMANIGWIYENGFGLPQRDCNLAMTWYKKAVSAGDSIALWNIGRMYDLGCGDIPQNFQEARNFYKQAAAKGVKDADRDLKKLDDAGH